MILARKTGSRTSTVQHGLDFGIPRGFKIFQICGNGLFVNDSLKYDLTEKQNNYLSGWI